MAKASAKKSKSADDTIVGGWIQRDTPDSPYLFPNLHMEKPAAKKKPVKTKPKKK